MNGLRSEWKQEQIQENLGEANENLPVASATDRFPVAGTASGMDLRAGEDVYAENAGGTTDSAIDPRMPADPPRRPTNQDGA